MAGSEFWSAAGSLAVLGGVLWAAYRVKRHLLHGGFGRE